MTDLSPAANFAWQVAAQEAAAAKFEFIEPEHILIGICSLEKLVVPADETQLDSRSREEVIAENDAIKDILRDLGLDPTQLRRSLRRELGKGHYARTEQTVHRSPACKQVFERTAKLVPSGGQVSCFQLIQAILKEPTPIITKVLKASGGVPGNLHDLAEAQPGVAPANVADEHLKVHVGEPKQAQSNTPILDSYGRDLTQAAREGKLGPFIGRRKELLQIIQTLARTSKNNPVLVGEAGVGKTAVVEALALRIFEGKDFEVLKGKRIIELNMGALTADTKYRGRIRGTAGEYPE